MKNSSLQGQNILGFGEVMLRLTPPSHKRILQADSFEAIYSGGEANVIASLSYFGYKTKFVTKVPNNDLGQMVINKLKSRNINVDDVIRGTGRLGIYYSEIGHGLRSTEVIYDREYSTIAMAQKEEFDLDQILEGVTLVHLSGITPALGKGLKELTLEIAKKCKEKNIAVSYDSNYRSKLWSIEEAKEVLEAVLESTDYAFLGYLDMINILGFETKETEFEKALTDLYSQLFAKYPNIKYAACTKRTVNTINNNTLQGFVYTDGKLYTSKAYTFDILDRVGGGDAFTAGILNGILKGMDHQGIAEFGVAASALKHSIVGDVNLIDEETVNHLINSGLCNIRR